MAQQSKRKLSPSLEKELYRTFFQVLSDIRDKKEAEDFCNDFFTETELALFIKRLGIAVYLDKKHSYNHISRNLNVSTATIATVAEQMKDGGFQRALELIKTEQWAEKLSGRIFKIFKNSK